MRKLFMLSQIIGAGIGLVFVVGPHLPGGMTSQAASAGGAAVSWASHQINPSSTLSSTPASTPAPDTRALPPPASLSPAARASAVPTSHPIAASHPNTPYSPAPTSGAAPTAAPTAPPRTVAPVSVWAPSCAHLEAEMILDGQLDQGTADASSGDLKATYHMWSVRWYAVAQYMQSGPCATPQGRLTSVECSNPPGWFATAIYGHQYDMNANPQNTAWDSRWINVYSQLTTLWHVAPGCS